MNKGQESTGQFAVMRGDGPQPLAPAQEFMRSVLIVSNRGRFCWRAVRSTDIRIAVAPAPRSLRLPAVIFRITTAGRNAHSAALLVPSTFVRTERDPWKL